MTPSPFRRVSSHALADEMEEEDGVGGEEEEEDDWAGRGEGKGGARKDGDGRWRAIEAHEETGGTQRSALQASVSENILHCDRNVCDRHW